MQDLPYFHHTQQGRPWLSVRCQIDPEKQEQWNGLTGQVTLEMTEKRQYRNSDTVVLDILEKRHVTSWDYRRGGGENSKLKQYIQEKNWRVKSVVA